MGRKVRRVPYQLDPKDVKVLPLEEIRVILRGADDLIRTGGRSLLSKILRILLLLRKVEATGDDKYIPLLEAWRKVAYKKVRNRIRQVISNLEGGTC